MTNTTPDIPKTPLPDINTSSSVHHRQSIIISAPSSVHLWVGVDEWLKGQWMVDDISFQQMYGSLVSTITHQLSPVTHHSPFILW